MKTDASLKAEVEDALLRDFRVGAQRFAVGVESGVVSLFGEVRSYPARIAAAESALGVLGVRSVTLGLTVRPLPECRRTDVSLEAAATRALRHNPGVPSTVRIKVSKGWITLEGDVDRSDQRDAAEHTVEWLDGVLGTSNHIGVEVTCSAAEALATLRAARERMSDLHVS
jgi:osmotically-inducible protein OsmY